MIVSRREAHVCNLIAECRFCHLRQPLCALVPSRPVPDGPVHIGCADLLACAIRIHRDNHMLDARLYLNQECVFCVAGTSLVTPADLYPDGTSFLLTPRPLVVASA